MSAGGDLEAAGGPIVAAAEHAGPRNSINATGNATDETEPPSAAQPPPPPQPPAAEPAVTTAGAIGAAEYIVDSEADYSTDCGNGAGSDRLLTKVEPQSGEQPDKPANEAGAQVQQQQEEPPEQSAEEEQQNDEFGDFSQPELVAKEGAAAAAAAVDVVAASQEVTAAQSEAAEEEVDSSSGFGEFTEPVAAGEESGDDFGDFSDAPPASAPPPAGTAAAPAATPTPHAPTDPAVADLLSQGPVVFLAAAQALLASLVPSKIQVGTARKQLQPLEALPAPVGMADAADEAGAALRWHGTPSEARFLARLVGSLGMGMCFPLQSYCPGYCLAAAVSLTSLTNPSRLVAPACGVNCSAGECNGAAACDSACACRCHAASGGSGWRSAACADGTGAGVLASGSKVKPAAGVSALAPNRDHAS